MSKLKLQLKKAKRKIDEREKLQSFRQKLHRKTSRQWICRRFRGPYMDEKIRDDLRTNGLLPYKVTRIQEFSKFRGLEVPK